jgi:hypothetical protein
MLCSQLKWCASMASYFLDLHISLFHVDPFLGVTGHYIDTPADSPEDWNIKSEQLAYTLIEGNHSGDNLSKILVNR